MAKKDKNELYSSFDKQFLDVDSSFADSEFGSVSWSVTVRKNAWKSKKKKENLFEVSGDLRLTDCFKVINLQVCANDLEEIDERIRKIIVLRDSVNGLLASLKEAKKVAQKHLKAPYVEEPKTEAEDDD